MTSAIVLALVMSGLGSSQSDAAPLRCARDDAGVAHWVAAQPEEHPAPRAQGEPEAREWLAEEEERSDEEPGGGSSAGFWNEAGVWRHPDAGCPPRGGTRDIRTRGRLAARVVLRC